ncbi:hypothetical protein GCM10022267_31080 [Lentzea roselyniae]|uniref:Uncharacterized protein n=1 Tax=Lentzea roselyniae TaxID=531940 RepID=A0ABP7AX65_9PSEU
MVHAIDDQAEAASRAEANPADRMAGIGDFDPATGKTQTHGRPSSTIVFGDEIVRIGVERPGHRLHDRGDAAAGQSHTFAAQFPYRVLDLGIAEQHAVCASNGALMVGLHPVLGVDAALLSRVFDQVGWTLPSTTRCRSPSFRTGSGSPAPDRGFHYGMWDTTILSAIHGLSAAALHATRPALKPHHPAAHHRRRYLGA